MKPQIDADALDGPDASPHVKRMAVEDEKRKPPGDPREAKLAQALRANLRRRKAAPAPPASKPHKSSTD